MEVKDKHGPYKLVRIVDSMVQLMLNIINLVKDRDQDQVLEIHLLIKYRQTTIQEIPMQIAKR